MAIASSGAVSFSDLRTEFVGGSAAISYSDLYRGGSNIRAKAANNTGVNLAASVPTSGTINMTNFRSTEKAFRFTYTSGATNQNASALFGDDYAVDYPKEIVIDSGVELGATSTSEEALEIPSGSAGSITVTNNGTLSGAGGAAGQAGGDAFETAVAVTLINNGTIRAGGGGGGTGGDGSYESITYYPYSYSYNDWLVRISSGQVTVERNNVRQFRISGNYYNLTSYGVWRRGSYYSATGTFFQYVLGQASTAYSNGGSGGVGQGYNQSAGSGASGANNSGDGGTGGGFGSAGSAGANGNSTNGSSGGAAGNYISGLSFVTLTQSGTVQGGTA